jgi:hypothetical protein
VELYIVELFIVALFIVELYIVGLPYIVLLLPRALWWSRNPQKQLPNSYATVYRSLSTN